MRSTDLIPLLGMKSTEEVLRIARRAGIVTSVGSGNRITFSPGDGLATMVVAALQNDGPRTPVASIYAEGARRCGEALDSGFTPAYLITRGGTENVVVLETEDPAQTDEMVAALLLQASDAGAAVRVVKLRPMVKRLAPFLAELVDA